jgi:hypothetical protein
MNPSPSAQWAALKQETLDRIKTIDKATPWAEVEPQWWLEMMRVADDLRNPDPNDPARINRS